MELCTIAGYLLLGQYKLHSGIHWNTLGCTTRLQNSQTQHRIDILGLLMQLPLEECTLHFVDMDRP